VGGGLLIGGGFAYRNQQLPRLAAQRRLNQAASELAARQAAVEANPNDVAAHWALANWLGEHGRAAETEPELRKIVEIDPGDQGAWRALAQGLALQGRFPEALAANRELIRRWPEQPTGYAGAAVCYRGTNELKQALQMAQAALQRSPNSVDARLIVGVVAVDYADQAASAETRSGEYQLAAKMLEQVVKERPELADAHTRLGRAYRSLYQEAKARACFRKAAELAPESADAQAYLAEMDVAHGDLKEARAAAEALVQHHPEDPRGHYWLGYTLLQSPVQGALAQAAAALGEAVRLQPDNAKYRERHGIALLRAGRLPEAREAFEHAADLNPNRAFAPQQLAIIYARLGEAQQAKVAQEDAARRAKNEEQLRLAQAESRANPGDLSLHLLLADRYQVLGWQIPSRDEYRAALALEPKNARARAGLQALAGTTRDLRAP
jgi:tetratricopeptide (TPR) repeat protein